MNIGSQSQSLDIKTKYVFDYYIKLTLSCSDGDFMKEKENSFHIDLFDHNYVKPDTEEKLNPKAQVYFKFSHKNHEGKILNNSD